MIRLWVAVIRFGAACYEWIVVVVQGGRIRLHVLRIKVMQHRIEATNRRVRRIMARQQRRKAAMQQWIDRL